MPDLSTSIDFYNQSLGVEIESGHFAKRLLVLQILNYVQRSLCDLYFFIFKILPDQL